MSFASFTLKFHVLGLFNTTNTLVLFTNVCVVHFRRQHNANGIMSVRPVHKSRSSGWQQPRIDVISSD